MSKIHSRVWLITGCSTGFGRKLSEAVLAKGDRPIASAANGLGCTDVLTCRLY
jgi:NAD(P)-dependent dehydrogenase (short-subunit alcohol dehydrogenase family)